MQQRHARCLGGVATQLPTMAMRSSLLRHAYSFASSHRSIRHLIASGLYHLPSAYGSAAALSGSARSADACQWRRMVSAPAALPSDEDSSMTSDDEQQQLMTQCLPDRIGFLGAGQMAQAIIKGLLAAGVSAPRLISTSNCRDASRQRLQDMGLTTFGPAQQGGAAQVAACSDIIFLGVKPQNMPQVLAALAPHVGPHHLIISIAAGVTLPTYEAALPEGTRVIRIMPNTPMLVQQGASAYCLGRWATEEDEQKLNVLLRPTGLVVPVEEKMMDAVTGLSGSGPAFVYMMIEAMADGGVLAGLPRERALQLAAQTVAGAAHMVMEACEDGELAHPGVLKDKVASPAGTTIAGISVLEAAGMRGAVMSAVGTAAARSKELSKQ